MWSDICEGGSEAMKCIILAYSPYQVKDEMTYIVKSRCDIKVNGLVVTATAMSELQSHLGVNPSA